MDDATGAAEWDTPHLGANLVQERGGYGGANHATIEFCSKVYGRE
jgi:hypothetical protein